MPDRENVIKWFECDYLPRVGAYRKDCKHGCDACVPMHDGDDYCDIDMLCKVLDLLKEQPEIVRCRDCKFRQSRVSRIIDGKECNLCEMVKGYKPADWYCADGERRRNEKMKYIMNMREDDPYDVCTRETYVLPMKVEIQSEEPDATMREIAETIYDAVSAWSLANIGRHPGRTLDVQWSIYKKPDPKTFGQQVTGK